MATYQEIQQITAYARIDGAIMAAIWVVSFACFIGNFYNPMLGLAFFITGASSLVVGVMRLKGFRDNVLNGIISFRRSYAYSLMTYMNAALLFALVQFLYFKFLDKGFLMTQYLKMAETKEFTDMMRVYGLTAADLKFAMENIAALRPIEVALQFFTSNVLLGIFISLPVALVIKRTPKRFYRG